MAKVISVDDLRFHVSGWFNGYGKKYGDEPYSVHLDEVCRELTMAGFLESEYSSLHQAALLHDVFEDLPITPGLVIGLGADYSAVIYALLVTDQPGITRKDRKLNSYPVIASSPWAVILKLADRLANVRRGGKLDMYRKEYPDFRKALLRVVSESDLAFREKGFAHNMWDELDKLMEKQDVSN